eukprot:scaffold21550_cov18-Tisochrysis_lutea.AAC.1
MGKFVRRIDEKARDRDKVKKAKHSQDACKSALDLHRDTKLAQKPRCEWQPLQPKFEARMQSPLLVPIFQ